MAGQTLLRAVIDASGLPRRRAFEAIRAGRVSVDGRAAVDPSAPHAGGALALDGRALAPPDGAKTYLVLNKPPGYLSTVRDDRGRPTVLDLVPDGLRAPGLHPVGRLDLDTSGLLILTNDGDLTFHLTHPSHAVEKEYWAATTPPPAAEALATLRRGVAVEGALRRPAALGALPPETGFHLSITVREGRKRQVRRMLEAAGLRVRRLHRVREGPLRLDLPEGALRRLSATELRLLRGRSGADA